ncbi:putative prophage protein [Klebsiella pneumoniae]|uniref:Putative prophage protein n=1 Tax=Klebsiella pneumoniae TaxID=573 RepID=A0A377Y6N8_KLEPN|nr:putative prophage protein [Klebsiella pneumoniae]
MSGFGYLMAQGQPLTPARFTANSFKELCKAILSHSVQISITTEMTDEERRKEKQKLYWFSAPTQRAGQRRIVGNMAACAFGCADIDESSPGAMQTLLVSLRHHSVLVYQTASHTAASPRMRIVYEFSRLVEPDERRAVCEATESMLMQEAGFTLANLTGQKARWENGSNYLVLDRSVYGAQSYLYCPHVGAKSQLHAGAVIAVDALPEPAQPVAAPKPKAKKQAGHEASPETDADFDDLSIGPDTSVISDLRSALWHPGMLQKAHDNGAWIDQGYRLASLKGTDFEDDARQLWIDWSVTAQDAYEEDLSEGAAARWEGLEPDKTSYKAIFADAQVLGWVNEATKRAANRLNPRVERRDDGMYYIVPRINKRTGEIEEQPPAWLCSAVDVLGRGTDGSEEYIVLSWLCNVRKVTEAIPLCDIGERDGWRRMKAGGLNVTSKNSFRAVLGDYLQLHDELTRWNVAKTTGWQHGAYIMPDGEILGTSAKPVIFCGHSATAQGYTVKGTPESWRDNVARLAAGNPSMVTAIAAAFAAPMLSLVGADGFGIHFYEQSSAGKTTTANTAASLYGSPDKTKLTWYGTALGMVNEAAAHNDGFMSLDEISQNTRRRDVAESAYALFNGVGKLQGRRDGGNREVMRYTTVALSTGETDLESFIREDGGSINAGQLVRLLNIPLTRASDFHSLPDGKSHADALKTAYQNHYGAVGRKWISTLAENPKAAQEAVAAAKQRWKGLLPAQGG